jgi:amino acid permease
LDGRKKLRIAGEALFGSNWQTHLAAELSVAELTMRRWDAGIFEVPDEVWKDIATVCRRRANAALKIADSL